jgi:hypothetical protein
MSSDDPERLDIAEEMFRRQTLEQQEAIGRMAGTSIYVEINVQEERMPKILMTTTLGAGNRGRISAADYDEAKRSGMARAIEDPEFYAENPDSICCIDQRAEDDIERIEGQLAGSYATTGSAASIMADGYEGLISGLVAASTRESISAGYGVTVHGDTHAGKKGCGANRDFEDSLAAISENADTVFDTTWAVAEALELDAMGLQKRDLADMANAGFAYGRDASKWDADAERRADIAVENGARYAELQGEHREKAIAAILDSGKTFNRKKFTAEHGGDGAFGVTFGVLKDIEMERGTKLGLSQLQIARRIAAGIMYNLSVGKVLTAEEAGNGEALPVHVVSFRKK